MSKRVLPAAALAAALAVTSVSGISQVLAQEAAPQQESATEDVDALVERVGEVAQGSVAFVPDRLETEVGEREDLPAAAGTGHDHDLVFEADGISHMRTPSAILVG